MSRVHLEKRRAADNVSFCFSAGGPQSPSASGNREKQTQGVDLALGSLQLHPLLAFARSQQARLLKKQRLSQDSGGVGTHSLGGCSLWQGTPSALLPRPSGVCPSRPRERVPTAVESCLLQLPRREAMERLNWVSGDRVPGPSCPRYPRP